MHLVARETLPEPNSQGRLGTRGVSYLSTWQSGQVSYGLFEYFIVEKSQVLVLFCEEDNGILLYMFVEN